MRFGAMVEIMSATNEGADKQEHLQNGRENSDRPV